MALGFAAVSLLSSCVWADDFTPANKDQITQALQQCAVVKRDFARDRDLAGRYLVMLHHDEPALAAKRDCITAFLKSQGAVVTILSPEPTNRSGLY